MKAQSVADCKNEYQRELDEIAKQERMKVEAEGKVLDRKKKFFDCLEASKDLNEQLQELCDYVHDTTSATGVYIGKLVN